MIAGCNLQGSMILISAVGEKTREETEQSDGVRLQRTPQVATLLLTTTTATVNDTDQHLEQLVLANTAVDFLGCSGNPVVELQRVIRRLAVAVGGQQEQHQVLAREPRLMCISLYVLDRVLHAVTVALQQLRPVTEQRTYKPDVLTHPAGVKARRVRTSYPRMTEG